MERNKYPVSLASYSFHNLLENGMYNIWAYLEDIKFRYNVEYADIWNGYLESYEEDYLKKIKASMDEKGITLANLCVDGAHLWCDNPEEREDHYQKALQNIKAGIILGAKTIRIDWGPLNETVTDEEMEYTVAKYREYADICAEYGIKIGTENHWGSAKYPDNLEKLYNAVNHPNFGILFHFGNFVDGQRAKGLETVLKMAMHTHVPANSIPVAKEYIRRLVNAGYKGTFSVEHHSANLELHRVAWHVATVRGLIAELCQQGFEKPATWDYFKGIYEDGFPE